MQELHSQLRFKHAGDKLAGILQLARHSPLTLVYGTGSTVSTDPASLDFPTPRAYEESLQALALPMDARERVVLVNDWHGPVLQTVLAAARTAMLSGGADSTAAEPEDHDTSPSTILPGSQTPTLSLKQSLETWQAGTGIRFFFIFDRFDTFLARPFHDSEVRAFDVAFGELAGSDRLETSFLLVMDESQSSELSRYAHRFEDIGDDYLRMPDFSNMVGQTGVPATPAEEAAGQTAAPAGSAAGDYAANIADDDEDIRHGAFVASELAQAETLEHAPLFLDNLSMPGVTLENAGRLEPASAGLLRSQANEDTTHAGMEMSTASTGYAAVDIAATGATAAKSESGTPAAARTHRDFSQLLETLAAEAGDHAATRATAVESSSAQHPVSEAAAEPKSGTVFGSVVETIDEPMEKPSTDMSGQETVEPALHQMTGTDSRTDTEPQSELQSELQSEPQSERISESESEPANLPVSGFESRVVSGSAFEPAMEFAPESASKPAFPVSAASAIDSLSASVPPTSDQIDKREPTLPFSSAPIIVPGVVHFSKAEAEHEAVGHASDLPVHAQKNTRRKGVTVVLGVMIVSMLAVAPYFYSNQGSLTPVAGNAPASAAPTQLASASLAGAEGSQDAPLAHEETADKTVALAEQSAPVASSQPVIPKPETPASTVDPVSALLPQATRESLAREQSAIREPAGPRIPITPVTTSTTAPNNLLIRVGSPAQRARVQAAAATLATHGLTFGEIGNLRRGSNASELRYFHASDKARAMRTYKVLREAGVPVRRVYRVWDRANIQPGQYELWLGNPRSRSADEGATADTGTTPSAMNGTGLPSKVTASTSRTPDHWESAN